MSALNVFLFIEAYQKEILDYFEKEHCFSIRYHKKNTALYYKTKNGKYTDYFQKQINYYVFAGTAYKHMAPINNHSKEHA